MMSPVVLTLAFAICVAEAAVLELTDLKAKLNQEKYTCEPRCGDGHCCIHYFAPIHGGKRAELLGLDPGSLLPHSEWPGLIKRCEPLKQRSEKCLARDNGEWCPCAPGLTCKADGPTGLDAFFGKCV